MSALPPLPPSSPPLNYASPGAVPPPKPFWRGLLGWVIFLIVAALLFVWLRQADPAGANAIALSDFYAQLQLGNVAWINIDVDTIDGALRRPVSVGGAPVLRFTSYLPQGTSGNWAFTQMVLDKSPTTVVRATASNNLLTNFILPFIPWLLILFFIWFFVFRQLRRKQGQPTPVIVVNPEAR